jgi:hypothetical protein
VVTETDKTPNTGIPRVVDQPWVGVDFDATLFEYHEWVKWDSFGKIIPVMRDRVLAYLESGTNVRIVTARIGLPQYIHPYSGPIYNWQKNSVCKVSGEMFSDEMMIRAMQAHMVDNGLPPLWVQCFKDYNMIRLYDDRAVQVEPNTGRRVDGND